MECANNAVHPHNFFFCLYNHLETDYDERFSDEEMLAAAEKKIIMKIIRVNISKS